MKTYNVNRNPAFIGRETEIHKLTEIEKANKASIITVFGRRRIGKTELIEQSFRNRNLLKFEGIQGMPEADQMHHVLLQLSEYSGNTLYTKAQVSTWSEIFKFIADLTISGKWTLYFEEVQWLANYKDSFVSELKYVWDNYFRHNNQLVVVLCGSAPSFMINAVVKSKALYNRSQYTIPLREFSLIESQQLLAKRSIQEVMDAYLTVGGIPEYLLRLREGPSVFLNLCNNTFMEGSFFSYEYSKIFISSLATNKHYQKIIEFLSKKHFATRQEIIAHLKVDSGGAVTELLTDLEICDFIVKYSPFNLSTQSKLARYTISDSYLHFYFHFIKPIASKIDNGDFNKEPSSALNTDRYSKWLGFSFERFCRKNHRLISSILGFDAVDYKAGAFFNRATIQQDSGYQIDLVFSRKDKVYTICEIKYLRSKVKTSVITEFERKLSMFPNLNKFTIQKVLITNMGAEETLINKGYFDRIITLEDLFQYSE